MGVRQEAEERRREQWAERPDHRAVAVFVEQACVTAGVSAQALRQGYRGRQLSPRGTRLESCKKKGLG